MDDETIDVSSKREEAEQAAMTLSLPPGSWRSAARVVGISPTKKLGQRRCLSGSRGVTTVALWPGNGRVTSRVRFYMKASTFFEAQGFGVARLCTLYVDEGVGRGSVGSLVEVNKAFCLSRVMRR